MHACLLKHGTAKQRELAQRLGGTALEKANKMRAQESSKAS